MKPIVKSILTLGLAFTFFYCSNNDSKQEEKEKANAVSTEFDSTDLKTTEIDTKIEEEGFFIKYKFNVGESFSYRLTTLAHTESNLQTDSLIVNAIDQKIIRVVNLYTESIEKDSIAELKCTILNIFLDASFNSEKHIYQSGSELDSIDQKKYIEYEGLINNPFYIRITKYGELLDIYKVDQIIDRYIDLSGLKDSVRTKDKAVFKDQIINTLLKPFVIQIFREVPSEKLKVESTWDKELVPGQMMVFKIQNTNHYKVTNLEMLEEDKIAVIQGSVTTSIEGDTNITENGIDYEFKKPETEATGKIYFNLDKGLISKSKTKNKFSVSYSMQRMTPIGLKKGNTTETMINDNILELL